MNLVKRLFQHRVDRFKRGKGCEAQRGKAVWQHQSDAKQGALRDRTFRTEAKVQAINMLMDSPSWCPNWWLLSACARSTFVYSVRQSRRGLAGDLAECERRRPSRTLQDKGTPEGTLLRCWELGYITRGMSPAGTSVSR